MDIRSLDTSEIKAKSEEEKRKHQELIEVSRNTCEIKIDINKTDIRLTQGQKEMDNLIGECINLQIEYDLALKKENMLKNKIKDLQNICDNSDALLNEKCERLFKEINEFKKNFNEFLKQNNSVKNETEDFENDEGYKTKDMEEIELEGEISGLELFLSVQNKILQELNTM